MNAFLKTVNFIGRLENSVSQPCKPIVHGYYMFGKALYLWLYKYFNNGVSFRFLLRMMQENK